MCARYTIAIIGGGKQQRTKVEGIILSSVRNRLATKMRAFSEKRGARTTPVQTPLNLALEMTSDYEA